MEREQALAILKTLSDGRDPASGLPFPAASPYQHPDVVRALFCALHALETPPARARKALPSAGKSGQPWSREEDERLVAGFDAGQPVEALAETHGRSRLAIEARLARFGKVPVPEGVRFAGTPRAAEPMRRPA